MNDNPFVILLGIIVAAWGGVAGGLLVGVGNHINVCGRYEPGWPQNEREEWLLILAIWLWPISFGFLALDRFRNRKKETSQNQKPPPL
jgi:hypothetical protein